jgi:hypothetical protein
LPPGHIDGSQETGFSPDVTTLPSLNSRHKAGLSVALAATGASLLLDASAKQTAGVVLLGLAAAWFFGSVGIRTLGVILSSIACCVGLYIATSPIWNERNSVLASAQEYDSAVAEVRGAIAGHAPKDSGQDWFEKNAPKPKMVPIPPGAVLVRPVQIPELARKWVRPNPPDIIVTDYGVSEFGFPAEMSERDVIRKIQADDLLPRPTFSLKDSIASHPIACLGGSSLSLLGLLGFVFLIRRVAAP